MNQERKTGGDEAKRDRFDPPTPRFSNSGRNSGVLAAEESSGQHQVGEGEQ